MSPANKWVDRNAGPVVRPYTLTGGRTEQADGTVLDLVDIIVAQDQGRAASVTPEERMILGLCQRPLTVTDIASSTGLPLGVVRILLSDLIQRGLVTVLPRVQSGDQPSTQLLQEVLHGLRAL
jgi:hypothetical protein